MMRSLRRIGLAAVVLGLAGAPAHAGFTFNFQYDFASGVGGPDFIASGVLTTTDVLNPDGSYTITGITGIRSANGATDTITGLLPPDSLGGNDNELFLTGPYLDISGVSFAIDNSTNGNRGNQVNVYFDGFSYTEDDDSAGFGSFIATRATATPEPSSIALCGTAGVIGLAVARVRRWRVTA